MDAQSLRKELTQGELLFDGATGTYAKSLPDWPDGPVELACLTAPEKVAALHQAYITAGSRAVKTNTFAAHAGLAARDEQEQKRFIAAAVGIARRSAGRQAYVFADIGPAPAQADAAAAYTAMADCFLAEDVDCFLFETLASAQGVIEAAEYIKEKKPEAYVMVSFASGPDGFTREGENACALIAQIAACDAVDAVGLNCVCGAYHMRRLLAGMKIPQGKALIAMPNAGYPHVVDGRTYYDSDPLYYAQQVAGCAMLGASIIGGCCGTTPEHILQLSRQLDASQGIRMSGKTDSSKTEVRTCKSRVRRKLDEGKRVVLVELDPPRDSGISAFVDGAKRLAAAGADAVTIADCPIGRARMDSSLLACKLSREYNIEAIPHMTCRDRNVNATKALLLGLSMEGVHNVLAVTGDPVPAIDRDSVKSVFQFNSRVMARFVRSLSECGEADPFFLCGALNVNAVNFESELERAADKERCGMEAFLTQPVLTEQAAVNLERARGVLKGRILGGLFPVVSHKNALFLDSEVAGISVDPRVIGAYEGLDRSRGEEMAVRLCADAAVRIAPYVDGFYIMTPFQRVELVCRVMEAIRNIK